MSKVVSLACKSFFRGVLYSVVFDVTISAPLEAGEWVVAS